ncbi:thiamine pyrophosphate-binding protein [Plastoroseomonas arctica]|uniref:Thiamine pyrophosphate-binding protein n=1 Tax=Plastoroseomonas arctica TaxID=1509237 RepID=A0AAF1JZP3_9PROT|nr:thiamine pyrophosphate-binding protein [Plastoroseomonas arctica]MBR0654576.1 thiamine pyrophosphate-binding protein [Plastoroseomonas arctica]
MPVTGSQLVGQALKRLGVDTFFFLMGAPMLQAEKACIDLGIRGIDVRHEQAAAMMAHAYARLRNVPGVCMACSGPGALNLGTGLANALVDCAPVVALGGSSPVREYGTGAFQEFDQLAAMKPLTKWAERVYETRRIPEMIATAFRIATSGKPGPVYLDLPGDVLFAAIEEADVVWPAEPGPRPRPAADPAQIAQAVAMLAEAERPVIISGSGVLWSGAAETMQAWVEQSGIPFYTTPQGRGVVPEDHALAFANARSAALREADLVLVLGTRLNYVFGHGKPPRFAKNAKLIRIDIDPAEIAATPQVTLGICADLRVALEQLSAAATGIAPARYAAWTRHLAEIEATKAPASEVALATDQTPIHPLRLCREIRDFLPRDAILCVDGQEILNYGRQTIPTHTAGHRLNSGPFGIMGVGLPFGLGAKAAKPDKMVLVLHGDGSFGLNAMELDTAVRHGLPVIVVISLNGGWTADPDRSKPGRELGYTRFDAMAEALGCHGEFVERPEDIAPALARAAEAVAAGRPALVNVVTDWKARAQTVRFSASST